MNNKTTKLGQLLLIFLSISITACSTQINVTSDSISSIDALPKNAVIRVILASSFSNQSPFDGSLQWQYKARAKLLTEYQLETLGLTVVDKGLSPKNDGKPTLIVIVDSSPVEDQYQISNYKMTLYKPSTKDSKILHCDTKEVNSYLCVAPQEIRDAEILYQANCLYQGAYNAPATVISYCIQSTLTNFPHSQHKKTVYENSMTIKSLPIQPPQ